MRVAKPIFDRQGQNVKTRIKDGQEYIFDPVRKKYVVLTPEEWVRQQVLEHLIEKLGYTPSLLSVERRIKAGTVWKRYDIVAFHKTRPWLLIECKEEKVNLGEDVLRQVLAYNAAIRAEYLAITNGQQLFCYSRSTETWTRSLPPLP